MTFKEAFKGRGFNEAASIFIALMLCLCITLLLVTNWRLKEVRHIEARVADAETLVVITKQLALRRGLRAIQGEGDGRVSRELSFVDDVLDERILQAFRVYQDDAHVMSVLNQVRNLVYSTRGSGYVDTLHDLLFIPKRSPRF
ncbi:MAG: hypothetical protein GYB21_20865 [Oceanospirillales bacterium]|nr:hypothetical protein [Oceanospirillales bacterium]